MIPVLFLASLSHVEGMCRGQWHQAITSSKQGHPLSMKFFPIDIYPLSARVHRARCYWIRRLLGHDATVIEFLGHEVTGAEFLGQHVVGRKSWGTRSLGHIIVGQKVTGAHSRGAQRCGACGHWGTISGAQSSGAQSSGAGRRLPKLQRTGGGKIKYPCNAERELST